MALIGELSTQSMQWCVRVFREAAVITLQFDHKQVSIRNELFCNLSVMVYKSPL